MTPTVQGVSFVSAIWTNRVLLVHMLAFDVHASVAAGKRTRGRNGCLTRKLTGSESARERPSALVWSCPIILYIEWSLTASSGTRMSPLLIVLLPHQLTVHGWAEGPQERSLSGAQELCVELRLHAVPISQNLNEAWGSSVASVLCSNWPLSMPPW